MINNEYRVDFTVGLNSAAKKIREAVFVEEQGFTDEFDAQDEVSYHAVLYKGEEAVGTARTYQQGNSYIVGRVAVIKSMRKHHLGTIIIEAVENKIKEVGGQTIELSAQVRVRGFYESLGYEAQGEEYLDEYCPHIKMTKQL